MYPPAWPGPVPTPPMSAAGKSALTCTSCADVCCAARRRACSAARCWAHSSSRCCTISTCGVIEGALTHGQQAAVRIFFQNTSSCLSRDPTPAIKIHLRISFPQPHSATAHLLHQCCPLAVRAAGAAPGPLRRRCLLSQLLRLRLQRLRPLLPSGQLALQGWGGPVRKNEQG